jgi:hypothetical protein
MVQKRFIVNETFTEDDVEYSQGAIYPVTAELTEKVKAWTADGKVRDPDAPKDDDDDVAEDEDDDDKDEPA